MSVIDDGITEHISSQCAASTKELGSEREREIECDRDKNVNQKEKENKPQLT